MDGRSNKERKDMVEKGIGIYQQVSFLTADPKKLTLICYRQAILNLKAAKEHYLAKEYEAKAKSLQKALDFICELNNALDFEKGGAIAANLDLLYKYITRSLLEADLKKNLTIFGEVIRMLEELESAWEEIFSHKETATLPAPYMIPSAAVGSKAAVAGRKEWSV
jgi:flagellar protein FliS